MLLLDAAEQRARLVGLRYAELFRQHFPDLFRDVIAMRATTHRSMFCVASTFLSMAHTHLIALDHERAAFGMVFELKDPTRALGYMINEWTARTYMAEGGRAWLTAPRARVYGVSAETVVPPAFMAGHVEGINRNALALLIWQLVANTRWSVLSQVNVSSAAVKWVNQGDYRRAICDTLPLPRAISLPALCAHLDATRPHGVGSLGTLIAMLCRRTGNRYADTAMQEVRDGEGAPVPIDWKTAAFPFERQEQKVAQQWATAYARLATRLWADPPLAVALRDAITEAAAHAAPGAEDADTYDPRWLGHRIGEL